MKDLGVVMVGTIIAQAVSFGIAPILSRIYTPEYFGVFGLYLAYVGTVGTVASLCIEQAILLVSNDEDSVILCKFSICIAAVVSVLSGFLGLFLAQLIYFDLKLSGLGVFAATTLGVFATGCFTSLQLIATRGKDFGYLSIGNLLKGVGASAFQCLFSSLGSLGLVIGNIFGLVLANTVLLHGAGDLRRYPFVREKVSGLIEAHKGLPIFAAPRSVANSFAQNVPMFLLAFLAGPIYTGAYAMAIRLVQTPMSLVTNPLRQVYFQRASESFRRNPRDLVRYSRMICVALFSIVLAPAALVFCFGAEIFEFVLGSKWRMAGEQTQWLILWLAVGFANVPAIINARIMKLERQMLVYDLVLLLARIAAVFLGSYMYGPIGSIAFFSCTGMLFNLLLIFWVDMQLARRVRLGN